MALIHGGDCEGYILETGKMPLDFSANCNPLGTPDSVVKAVCDSVKNASAYPDPLCRRLVKALSESEGVSEKAILCGAGAADIIFRLAAALKPKKALVTAPTFAEYELALNTVDCETEHYFLKEENGFALGEDFTERITPETDIVFVCNPNNPTGNITKRPVLEAILERCSKTGTLLVLDECFNDFLDEPERYTLKDKIKENKNLIILKAFTKLYGMAGIRLGYCLCGDRELIEKMREAGQPWGVSSLAQEAGIAALSEKEYVVRTKALIKEERKRLKEALSELGAEVFGGEANYIFLKCKVYDLAAKMRSEGVLIRDCSNYCGLEKGYFRVAVRTREENNRLLETLEKVIK
ncbi:MAG: threonine-phosphate decarboxylase CobD [Oscillospiraceae bacterium]